MFCFVVGIGRSHSSDFYNWAKSLISDFDFTPILSDCRIRNGENGIHFLLNRDGKRRGDALIEMESEQDVQKALEKHRMYMGQRYVEGTWSHVLAFCELSLYFLRQFHLVLSNNEGDRYYEYTLL